MHFRSSTLLVLLSILALHRSSAATLQRTDEALFGNLPDGRPVRVFTLRNAKGASAKIINYGATIIELQMPDRNGAMTSVLLGTNRLENYVKGFPAASVIGRVGNRIANARFTLDGAEYKLAANSAPNHIHGG